MIGALGSEVACSNGGLSQGDESGSQRGWDKELVQKAWWKDSFLMCVGYGLIQEQFNWAHDTEGEKNALFIVCVRFSDMEEGRCINFGIFGAWTIEQVNLKLGKKQGPVSLSWVQVQEYLRFLWSVKMTNRCLPPQASASIPLSLDLLTTVLCSQYHNSAQLRIAFWR